MWVALLIFAQLLPLDANKVCIAHSDDGYCESQVGVHFFSVIQLGAAEVVKVSIPQNRFTLATAKPSVTARQPQPEAPSILELLEKNRRTMMGSSWSLPVWPCLGVSLSLHVVACALGANQEGHSFHGRCSRQCLAHPDAHAKRDRQSLELKVLSMQRLAPVEKKQRPAAATVHPSCLWGANL